MRGHFRHLFWKKALRYLFQAQEVLPWANCFLRPLLGHPETQSLEEKRSGKKAARNNIWKHAGEFLGRWSWTVGVEITTVPATLTNSVLYLIWKDALWNEERVGRLWNKVNRGRKIMKTWGMNKGFFKLKGLSNQRLLVRRRKSRRNE